MARKIKIPTETFDNAVLLDSERRYPSLECLDKNENKELEKRIRYIIEFEDQCRVPYQVADYLAERLSGRPGFAQVMTGDESLTKKKKFFFRDSWDGDSLIIVKEGELPIVEGINIIIAHSDAPCLRIKPKPALLKWDDDEVYNYLGVRLSAIPHGGLSIHQWPAQQVQVLGYIHKNGARHYIKAPGILPDYSGHVEDRAEDTVEEAFDPDLTMEVVLGHTSVKETLKRFDLESIDDFGRAKLFAVPTNTPMPIDEYTWRLLCAFGHDDRIGVFAGVDALIKARDQKLTSILYITDNEEVSDTLPSGIGGPFFDQVLDYLMLKHQEATGQVITEIGKRRLLSKSSLLYGDVNIAPSGYDAESMDIKNAPKLGFGVSIELDQEYISSEAFADRLINFAKAGVSSQKNICHQVVGNFYTQKQQPLWSYEPRIKFSTLKFVRNYCLNVGVPTALSHSPNEIICPADELWASRFYRRFFERNTGD